MVAIRVFLVSYPCLLPSLVRLVWSPSRSTRLNNSSISSSVKGALPRFFITNLSQNVRYYKSLRLIGPSYAPYFFHLLLLTHPSPLRHYPQHPHPHPQNTIAYIIVTKYGMNLSRVVTRQTFTQR